MIQMKIKCGYYVGDFININININVYCVTLMVYTYFKKSEGGIFYRKEICMKELGITHF